METGNAGGRVRAVWSRLIAPDAWSSRRIAGEVGLSLFMALCAVGLEALVDSSVPRMAATALAVVALSLLRRFLPVTVLIVASVGASLLEGFGLVLVVAGWSAGRRIAGLWRALGAFTAAFVVNVTLEVYHEAYGLPVIATVLLSLVVFMTITVVPGLASRYWSQRRALLSTLQAHNVRLLRERAMIAGQARMRERQRIAQDMHDSLGHQLALISVHTGALEVDQGLSDRQREGVGVLREASMAAMQELREVVGILRDGVEGPQPGEDGQPAARGVAGIEGLVEASRAAGAAVELHSTGERRPLASAADHAAYRIVQEGLTNAHKHAPGARITVELRYEPDSMVLELANGPVAPTADGPSGSVVSGGQGLTGLRERARLIGGMVHAGPAADGGFRLAGVLPYGSESGQPVSVSAAAAAGVGGGPPWSTLVDVEDDFRGQIPMGPLGDGGPDIDWSGSQRELAAAMSGNKRGNGLKIGCGIALVILLALGALAVWGFVKLSKDADKGLIEPQQYRGVKVGQSEKEVRAKLPKGDSALTSALKKGGPPKPKGAECLVLGSTEGGSWESEPVFRFCFKSGKLIEKRTYEVKQ